MRRGVLVALLALALGLLTISYRDGGTALQGPQMVFVQAVSPIERGLTRAWQPVQDSVDWIGRLFTATNQNPDLHKRVDELETRLAVANDIEAENDRLRDVLALKQRGEFPQGYDKVMANMMVRSPTAADRSFLIDRGSDDGVSVNDAVMVTRGLVGRIEAVSPNAARVGLITNKSQAVSAYVVGSNATGVLRAVSNEGSPVMELAYVPQGVRVKKNDLVMTSGWRVGELTSIYPGGIPLGVVSSVGNSPADLYKTVQVTPWANFDRIDEVFVLVPTAATRSQKALVAPVTPLPAQTARATTRRNKANAGTSRPSGNGSKAAHTTRKASR